MPSTNFIFQENSIIPNNPQYSNNTIFDKLKTIKKRNNATLFEYFHLANKYKHLQKNLITFTYMDCDVFSKLDMINDIRNYFNKLVKNTRNDNIKFFSNIELGEHSKNPHVHIQVWHDNQNQMDKIYNKVIDNFGLYDEFCDLEKDDGSNTPIFEYVVKDYRKELTDEELLSLDDSKRVFRGVLDKKIRFSSHSKGKYTKAVYKSLYSKFDLKKNDVDLMLDNCIIDIRGNVDSRVVWFIYFVFNASFMSNKIINRYECVNPIYFFKYKISIDNHFVYF